MSSSLCHGTFISKIGATEQRFRRYDMCSRFFFRGKATHPKNTHLNKHCLHKQFGQTLSAYFLLILKGKEEQFAQIVPKLFAQTVCLFGCFFWGGGGWAVHPSLL